MSEINGFYEIKLKKTENLNRLFSMFNLFLGYSPETVVNKSLENFLFQLLHDPDHRTEFFDNGKSPFMQVLGDIIKNDEIKIST